MSDSKVQSISLDELFRSLGFTNISVANPTSEQLRRINLDGDSLEQEIRRSGSTGLMLQDDRSNQPPRCGHRGLLWEFHWAAYDGADGIRVVCSYSDGFVSRSSSLTVAELHDKFKFDWREILVSHDWAEGKVISIVDGSYRTRVVVTCYSKGRQKAEFANGPGNYAAYVELTRPDGTWISQGMGIVPVLPDGRLLMVVEQRPPQFRLPNQPTSIMVGGKTIDLRAFGPYSSLEFPGGAVDPQGNTLKAGFLKDLEVLDLNELVEETEIPEQTATVYLRKPPFFAQGADLALEGQVCVAYLTNLGFESHVKTDGGLDVMALSPADVQRNIWAGNIRSGQAVLLAWAFYQEVEGARFTSSHNPSVQAGETSDPIEDMLKSGYLSVQKVKIIK